ncbi:hypothetical protein F4805DRAFT_472613 [Annulohypoxylon moriforme]|nr:hypothetical protein F4805DRAFT_472613 [Annulohypoxylon moriforme]
MNSGTAKLVTESAKTAAKWVAENPKSTAAYGVAGAAMIVPAAIAGPALAAFGFTSSGIAAGSVAAGAQAAAGNVAAGSAFATLQSAAMAGYGAAIVNGVIQAGGAVAAIATGGTAAMRANMRKRPRKSELVLIENTWASLKSNIKQDSGDASEDDMCRTEMEDAIDMEWWRFPLDSIKDLADSIPQQIEAFSKSEGSTGF